MAIRFMYKALLTAALGIASSLLLSATTTTSPTWSNTAGALALDPPAAPSNCHAATTTYRDRRKGNTYLISVSWRDNSSNEDGFILEVWFRNQSGVWVLGWSFTEPANSTGDGFFVSGRQAPQYRFRVKAFNASGDSAWSNWAH